MATKQYTLHRECWGCDEVYTALVSSTRKFRSRLRASGWVFDGEKRRWFCPAHSKIAQQAVPGPAKPPAEPRAIVPMDDAGRVKLALSVLGHTGDRPDMFRVRDAIAILKYGYLKPGGAK